MLKFTIEPNDVLFFGNGKPFNIGSNVGSIFPPFPHSIAAAIYAKFVAETGITIKNGKGIYKAVFGPFVEKNGVIYFPAPCDTLKEKKNDDSEKFKIANRFEGDDFSLIDINDTDLENNIDSLVWDKPDKNETDDYEPFSGFISIDGLKKWFNGKNITKNDLLNYEDIFKNDERISINIDYKTGTVNEEDGLYRVNFIQLERDVKFVFWVEADFDNDSLLKENNIENENRLLEIFKKLPLILKLGGEVKTARYSVEIHDFRRLFHDFKKNNGSFKKILFLTVGIFSNNFKNQSIIEEIDDFSTGVIVDNIIVGINSNYNKEEYGTKTVRAIKHGSVIYLKNDFNANDIITFFKRNDNFIGSNLVLVK